MPGTSGRNVGCAQRVHVSQLKKCLRVPDEQVALDILDIQQDLQYQDRLIKIIDTTIRSTRRSQTRFCRVQWSNHSVAEATWECEDDLLREFPHLFEDQ